MEAHNLVQSSSRHPKMLDNRCAIEGWDSRELFDENIAPYFIERVSDSGRTWWVKAIESEALRCDASTVSLRQLKSHYSKGGMTPQCLPSVLRQMIRQKRVGKLASPRGWLSSIGGFLLRAPGALISLAVSGEINLGGGQEEDEDGMLVVCACVDAAAARMRAIGRVLPLRCAQAAAKGERGTASDIQVVMSVLEERGEIMRFNVGGSDEVHVKVSSSTGIKAQVGHEDKVTIAVGVLESARGRVEARAAAEEKLAKECLRGRQRKRALECLKRKKEAERRVTSIDQQLSNLAHLAEAVEGARANAILVDAVREGTRVLQELTAATPIGQVEKVMSDAADAREDAEQVSEALCGDGGSSGFDMAEMERELEEIEGGLITGSDEGRPLGAVGRSRGGSINDAEANEEGATGARDQIKALLSVPSHLENVPCTADATAGQESGEAMGDGLRQPVME